MVSAYKVRVFTAKVRGFTAKVREFTAYPTVYSRVIQKMDQFVSSHLAVSVFESQMGFRIAMMSWVVIIWMGLWPIRGQA